MIRKGSQSIFRLLWIEKVDGNERDVYIKELICTQLATYLELLRESKRLATVQNRAVEIAKNRVTCSSFSFLPLEELLYARELRNLLLAAEIRKGGRQLHQTYIYLLYILCVCVFASRGYLVSFGQKMKTDGHKWLPKVTKKKY